MGPPGETLQDMMILQPKTKQSFENFEDIKTEIKIQNWLKLLYYNVLKIDGTLKLENI